MQLSPDVLATARQAPFLHGLSPANLETVLAHAGWQLCQPGVYFFMENAPAQKAYLLVEGKAKLLQVTPAGQQVLMGYVTPGQMFGLVAMLNDTPYPVSVQAVNRCRALWWDRPTLHTLLKQHPAIALNTIHILSHKVILFQNRIREMATQQVEQRIAHALVRLLRQVGRKVDDGILIDMPLSRQDLAEMTGTTLYTVSRVLKEWEKRGLVQAGRMNVLVRQPHGLVLIAEGMTDTN